MNIPVYEHKAVNNCFKVTTGALNYTKTGINSSLLNTKLHFTSKEYGADSIPVNINTLTVKQLKSILTKKYDYKDAKLPLYALSSKAYTLAVKLNIIK